MEAMVPVVGIALSTSSRAVVSKVTIPTDNVKALEHLVV